MAWKGAAEREWPAAFPSPQLPCPCYFPAALRSSNTFVSFASPESTPAARASWERSSGSSGCPARAACKFAMAPVRSPGFQLGSTQAALVVGGVKMETKSKHRQIMAAEAPARKESGPPLRLSGFGVHPRAMIHQRSHRRSRHGRKIASSLGYIKCSVRRVPVPGEIAMYSREKYFAFRRCCHEAGQLFPPALHHARL